MLVSEIGFLLLFASNGQALLAVILSLNTSDMSGISSFPTLPLESLLLTSTDDDVLGISPAKLTRLSLGTGVNNSTHHRHILRIEKE